MSNDIMVISLKTSVLTLKKTRVFWGKKPRSFDVKDPGLSHPPLRGKFPPHRF